MKKSHDHLRSAHYQAMRALGYTDDDIEKDWVQFCKDLNEYIDEIRELRGY